MDVERTMQFILDQQVKTEVLWQKNEERWQRNEQRGKQNEQRRKQSEERWKQAGERWKLADARMDRFEKSLVGIRKLMLQGARMLLASQAEIRILAAAQKRTDQKFERLMERLSRRSPNGRH